MENILTILFCSIFSFTVSNGQSIEVFSLPGGSKNYLKMIKHPGVTDLNGVTVCLRFG